MFNQKKDKEPQELTPAAIEAQRKQRSINRLFGLLVIVAVLLFAMLVYELIVLVKH